MYASPRQIRPPNDPKTRVQKQTAQSRPRFIFFFSSPFAAASGIAGGCRGVFEERRGGKRRAVARVSISRLGTGSGRCKRARGECRRVQAPSVIDTIQAR